MAVPPPRYIFSRVEWLGIRVIAVQKSSISVGNMCQKISSNRSFLKTERVSGTLFTSCSNTI